MSEPFNEEALMDRVDGDIEFLEETIAMLHEDCPDLLSRIEAAAASGDADALVKPAHALKGMLANFCAEPAEAAARELEMMGREQRLSDVASAVETLQKETQRLRNALDSYVQALKS